jgi:hypothetical protein
MFCFPSLYIYVGYEKLTTIYNHHIENTLNRRTSIRFGFDLFSLSYFFYYSKFMLYCINKICLC